MTFTPPPVIRFSALKQLARSPAHFRAYCESGFQATRQMDVGSIAHAILLGGDYVVYPGSAKGNMSRQGNEWKDFAAAHAGELVVTHAEVDEAQAIVAAVRANPVAMRHLEGARTEVPLSWEMHGMPCATGGVDWIGPHSWGDLKTCRCSEPEAFARDATRMLYYAQLAFYSEGLHISGLGYDADGPGGYQVPRIIAVESDAPHNVTVFRVPERVLERGRQSIALWFGILKGCIDSGQWPGYVAEEVTFELPSWMGDDDE